MSSFEKLREIMALLRDKERGCPWDIEQDFASIAPHTIEEAYEVQDAIMRDNKQDLCEELGDLLLQVVFHAQMAAEEQSFTLDDVIARLVEKLISRHPHVFGTATITTADEQSAAWDAIKAQEKAAKGDTHKSAMDDVPAYLPPLMRACKIQKKAAKLGFNWEKTEDIIQKLEEELAELKEALASKKQQAMEEELGDLLFVLCNLSNATDISPDNALTRTNQKFISRFRYIEQALHKQGKTPKESNLNEMDQLWNEAKQLEKKVQHS